jgi:hypothetical protein
MNGSLPSALTWGAIVGMAVIVCFALQVIHNV